MLARIARWLAGGLAVAVFGTGVLALGARVFADGPLGPFPGGPLRSGERVEGPVADWSFLGETRALELQLDGRRPTTRTVWLLVVDRQLYVPAAWPRFKRWPERAEQSGDVTLRIAGRLYPLRAVRVHDAALLGRLRDEMRSRYGMESGPGEDDIWFFRMEPRPRGADRAR